MDKGRIYNSLRNFIFGSLSQITSLILSFIVRSVFIHYFNLTYLGLNGLFTNILTILSLAELGFGTVMTHALYKPLCSKDEKKIISYMHFYAKIYKIIGVIVTFLGCSLIPFLNFFIKGNIPSDINITLLYSLFLVESISSYFFAYKRSILNADQKSYICSWIHFIVLLVRSTIQIIVIILFQNFIIYIIIQIFTTIFENIYIYHKVNKIYPYLTTRQYENLTSTELCNIKKNVYALILSNIARVAMKGSSNIIISALVGITIVGIYSNYIMISGAVIMILSQVFSAMTGSVGNYLAQEAQTKHLELFERLDFLNFWLYSVCAICLYLFFNPFIELWIGKQYTLDQNVVFIIVLNFILEGFLYTLWLFRSTMGLFVQGKYRPLFSTTINIIGSIILGYYWGLTGILLSTTISRILVNVWYDPYIIYKYGLRSSVKPYYQTYLKRFSTIIGIVITSIFFITPILKLNNKVIIILIIPIYFLILNIVFTIIYKKNIHYKYYKNFILNIIRK